MNRKIFISSLAVAGFALANPGISLALELPTFPGFPGTGTGTTADKATVLLECTPLAVSSTSSDGSSSCASSSSDGSVSCSSSSSSGTTPSTVQVLKFTDFHASSNTPAAVVDMLDGALNGSCATAIALVETDANSATGACSGPTGYGTGLVFSCTVGGDGSL